MLHLKNGTCRGDSVVETHHLLGFHGNLRGVDAGQVLTASSQEKDARSSFAVEGCKSTAEGLLMYGTKLLMEEILHQLIGSLSRYLQGLLHPRWCRISSINSILFKYSCLPSMNGSIILTIEYIIGVISQELLRHLE